VLATVHGHHKQHMGHALLNPANLLLLFLVFLWRRPTEQQLHEIFNVAAGGVFQLVRRVAALVAPIFGTFVRPPSRMAHVLQTAPLKDAAFATDTSHTRVRRPKPKEERKKYWFFKHGGCFAIKWQVTIGFDGRIWECGGLARPGSVSDRRIFEESELPSLVTKASVQGLGDSHYVRCVGMYGLKKGKKQEIVFAAYNKAVSRSRSLVENANNHINVCGLLNMEIQHRHPIRGNLRTLQTAVAEARASRRRARLGNSHDDDEEENRPKKHRKTGKESEKSGKHGSPHDFDVDEGEEDARDEGAPGMDSDNDEGELSEAADEAHNV